MFIEAFASLMQKAKIGTVGTDIFCHYLPANVKSGVLLINPNTGISIDHELQGFYLESFTIIVRVRPMAMPIIYPKNDGALIEAGIPVEFAGYLLN